MPSFEDAIKDPDIVSMDAVVPHPNFLVFGASGAGKTVLGGSDDKVLFISSETEGTLSSKRLGSTAHVINCEKWQDIEDFCDKAERWAADGQGIPFNWFVFDSITKAQDLLFDHINDEDGVLTEGWPQYRKNQKMLMRIIKRFNALPVNMLWLALDRKEVDPDGEEFYCPEIHGKKYSVAMQVAAEMTSYGYIQVKTEMRDVLGEDKKPVIDTKTGKPKRKMITQRIIWWQDIKTIRGKDRTLALAPFTRNLTLKDIRLRVEAAFAGGSEDGKPSTAK